MPDPLTTAPSARLSEEASAARTAAPAELSSVTIAPAWHTIAVLLVLLGVSLAGARIQLPALAGIHSRAPSYVLVMLIESGTVAFIWWGIRRRGIALSKLIGGRWTRGADVWRDLAIGFGFILVFGGAVQVLTSVLKVTPPQALRT